MTDYDARSALLVVDVQNDFADPGGSLYVKGGEAVVPFANAELARARRGGALVVFSQDWHPPSTPHFQTEGGVWPVHCVRDNWGAAFADRLDVGAAPLIRKGSGGEDGYSAFSARDPRTGDQSATELEALLRDHGIERVVIVGLATDYCVKETALDASRLGFAVTVLAAGVRAVDLAAGDGERALAAIEAAGGHVE
jgi:nicotinamidase/pyrazinamidase